MSSPAADQSAWPTLRVMWQTIWRNKVMLAAFLLLFMLLPSILAWCGAARLAVDYSFTEMTGLPDLSSRKTITLLFLQSALNEHQAMIQQNRLMICSENNEIRFTVWANSREQAETIAAGLVDDLSCRFSGIAIEYFQGIEDRLVLLNRHYADLAAVYALALDRLQMTQTADRHASANLDRLLADTLQKKSAVMNQIDVLEQLMTDLGEDKVRSSMTVQSRNLQISRYLAALICFAIAALLLIVFQSSRRDFRQKERGSF